MNAPEFTGDDEHDQAALRAAFPAWQIARANGQWWASRGLTREDPAGAVQARTAGDLYAVLASTTKGVR